MFIHYTLILVHHTFYSPHVLYTTRLYTTHIYSSHVLFTTRFIHDTHLFSQVATVRQKQRFWKQRAALKRLEDHGMGKP